MNGHREANKNNVLKPIKLMEIGEVKIKRAEKRVYIYIYIIYLPCIYF